MGCPLRQPPAILAPPISSCSTSPGPLPQSKNWNSAGQSQIRASTAGSGPGLRCAQRDLLHRAESEGLRRHAQRRRSLWESTPSRNFSSRSACGRSPTAAWTATTAAISAYSLLNACIGSRRDARHAGTVHAIAATASSVAATTAKTAGSSGLIS